MIRIIALTANGKVLAEKLQSKTGNAELWFKPKPFVEQVQQAFQTGDRLIMICATGIAVRCLAPVIKNKQEDPAVLVLDELGTFVIPILSGHEGGANQWGREIAQHLNAQLVSTTVKSYEHPIYAAGLGCERDCPLEELQNLFMKCLDKVNLNVNQIQSINSIQLKQNEKGLIQLGDILGIPYKTWSVEQLKMVESRLKTPSDYVYEIAGVYGVAESAALVAVANELNDDAELILTKQKTDKATCSIARSYQSNIN